MKFGATPGTRTPSATLATLRPGLRAIAYFIPLKLVVSVGLEPTSNAVSERPLNRIEYDTSVSYTAAPAICGTFIWSRMKDSNLRPCAPNAVLNQPQLIRDNFGVASRIRTDELLGCNQRPFLSAIATMFGVTLRLRTVLFKDHNLGLCQLSYRHIIWAT